MANRPGPEIDITEPLVRALLAEQAPTLADHSLELIGRGWDNTNWRLGTDLTVRLPHRLAAAELVVNEQRWLPVVAPHLDLDVPAPVVSGKPSSSAGYPWPWTIARWLPGDEAAATPPSDQIRAARDIATFFRQLHGIRAAGAPHNPHRGGPIAERMRPFSERVDGLSSRIDTAAAHALFADAVLAPPSDHVVLLHGDLHTRNLIVDRGRLSAVIDWGDVCSGDRAADLALTWMLVPDEVDAVVAGCDADEATWRRARGWAVHFAVTYLALSDDDASMTDVGTDLLRSLGIGVI